VNPFEFEDTRPSIDNHDVLDDLRRVARETRADTVTVRLYNERGRFSHSLVKSRFGSWNSALRSAGLTSKHIRNITDEELWNNIREVWMRLGHQPRSAQMRPPISKLTRAPYVRRFGSWLQAMREFAVAHKDWNVDEETIRPTQPRSAETPRAPSLRLRFLIMKRDGFRCRSCGRSPATTSGLELHIDHIAPWSKGGSTTESNLQTLCNYCNLGKSDISAAADV
jgi:hypothetical protein